MEQMSTTSSGVDLSTKFQKLAAEYAKLRAQLPVLKKAVVDEQTKASGLEEELGQKDQLVRTLTAESESLTFRNQQLAKRVEYLQERLDDTTISNGSSPSRFFRKPSLSAKHNRNAMPQSVSHDQLVGGSGGDGIKRALEEELKRKLEENERLNKQIFDIETAHQNEIAAMKNCIRLLESEAESLRNELCNIKDRQDAVLAEVRSEKSTLKNEVSNARLELTSTKRDLEESDTIRSELAAQLYNAKRLTSERILFDDGSRDDWNRLNAPSSESDSRNEFFQALSAFQPFVMQILTHTGLFHSYWTQRAQLYPHDTNLGESMSEANTKLSAMIRENVNSCRAIESTFQSLVDNCRTDDGFSNLRFEGISNIFKALGDYSRLLSDTLPLMERTVEEECATGWCNPRLEKENHSYLEEYRNFVANVNKLSGVLQPLAEPFELDSFHNLATEILSTLEKLDMSMKGICDQFSLKIINEHQLPVASRQLRTTNECVAAALNSASKYSSELVQSFREWGTTAIKGLQEIHQRRAEWALWKKQAVDYHRAVNSVTCYESITANEKIAHTSLSTSASWHNMRYNGLIGQKESYESEWKARLEDTQKSLGALEREKEKWVLETQLLKMKLEQCQQHQGLTTNQTPISQDDRSDDSAYVEEYYGNRVAELSAQLQDANSRIVFFQSECQNLLKTIQIYQKQKEKSINDLKTSAQQIATLKDELETTRNGYETQLSTLSEHLAQMNQKLTKQTDEIDMLRQAMKDKVQKKNRFK